MKRAHRLEFGDFQTPPELAAMVCRKIRECCGDFDAVLEPTCGVGAFVCAAAEVFPTAVVRGADINKDHVEMACAALGEVAKNRDIHIKEQDFFSTDWAAELKSLPGRLLLLGNPPWVTNSQVSALGGTNVPVKVNFLGLPGLAARTGKANFDISEWMLIRLLEAAKTRGAVMAMLCKTATARKLLRYAWQRDGRVSRASIYRIDAMQHFGAAVDACLLIAEIGTAGPAEADMHPSLTGVAKPTRFGLAGRELVADLVLYRRFQHLEGLSPYQWRSGLKHDCAAVMELTCVSPGLYRNDLGEEMHLESEFVFPFLKSTQLARNRINAERAVIVTQRRVGESTAAIQRSAPLAWAYLQGHESRFAARKSSIYQRGEPFAIFGIGDYAFAPWKVAVSALHRPQRFVVVPPLDGRPVMLDDTCYFIPFFDEGEARMTADILNSEPCANFLSAVVLPEAKRPVTTDLLHRLNLHAIAEEAGLLDEWKRARLHFDRDVKSSGQIEMVMEQRNHKV